MNSEHKKKFETVNALQEWGRSFRDKGHPISPTLFRAAATIVADIETEKRNSQWIKATDINRPGGWYWTRLGSDDESCPCVVFVTMDNDGDSAPDFRVVWNGESEHTAKRLSHYADNGWEFMQIPMPGYDFAAGGGTVDQASTKLPSAPGGNTCDHCGSELERECMICGAPNCCPRCCRETTREILKSQREAAGTADEKPDRQAENAK